jgi:starch phosphorylase
MTDRPFVAYFSMEIAIRSDLPTYSGGLGVLAGDTLRSSADLGLPVVGVTLLHRKGYFRQDLDADGTQRELTDAWSPEAWVQPFEPRVAVEVAGKPVVVRAWRSQIVGARGEVVPVYFLDTDLAENPPEARRLTDHLYGGDTAYRIAQEVVLGIGGVRMLRALGYHHIDRFHLNEGHAALAILALLDEELERPRGIELPGAVDAVRGCCAFTTHTPVPAGHDRFPADLVLRTLGPERCEQLTHLGIDGELNMTELALAGSRFVNGVAMRHGEVSRGLFPGYPIRSITNGVHPGTWVSLPFRALYDRHFAHWRNDPAALRGMLAVDIAEIAAAHSEAKRALLEAVRVSASIQLDPQGLVIGFARRATAYKRPTLVLRDLRRLERIASEHGPIQLVFAGKAHPRDQAGRALIREVFAAAARARGDLRIAFLPGYDMDLARLMVSGSDLWLNTPIPPLEASGTSGMKAALNGVPSLSILDGWWVEGCVEGVTGWAIGIDSGEVKSAESEETRDRGHADALYRKLEEVVAPAFYGDPVGFLELRRNVIALNAPYFTTHRMVLQYLFEAYRDDGGLPPPPEPIGL